MIIAAARQSPRLVSNSFDGFESAVAGDELIQSQPAPRHLDVISASGKWRR